MLTYSFADIGSDSLYEHLYKCIKNDIKKGVLGKNEKLPSKRSLAKNLGISVITVENAYAQLIAEGYIYSIAKKGYYVSDIKDTYDWDSDYEVKRQDRGMSDNMKNSARQIEIVKEKMRDRIDEEFSVSYDGSEGKYIADFTKNKMISDMFPFTIWTKLIREVLSEQQNALMTNPPSGGAMELRRAIAKHLKEFRGMIVAPKQIIIGAGTEYLYGLIIQLLGMDKKYGVEDPGYDKISKIYRCHGVKQDYIGMDEYGVIPSQVSEKKIDILHITPSHHFPTGIVMPISRRYELLGWANQDEKRYIIEDDYDSELRLNGQPIPALQSIDVSEKVIYINTFTKTLSSTVRISYMVLPEKLLEKFYRTLFFYSCTVSGFEQYAMAAFLEKGYFERHIRRLLNDYRGQRERICRMFRESPLSQISQIYQDDAGTHFLLHVRTELSDVEIKWAARQRGILVNCLSEYCFADAQKYRGILVIHYSDMADEILQKVIGALEEIFCNYSEP